MKRVLLLLFNFIFFFFLCFYQFYVPTSFSKEPSQVITIKNGSYLRLISSQLKDKGLIRSQLFFKLYVKWKKVGNQLKAGSFLLNPNFSISTIVQHLTTKNGNAALIKLTIPEGFSIDDISKRLESLGMSSASFFSHYAHGQAIDDFREMFPFLNELVDVRTVEGYLFPDTYFFAKDVSSKVIVETMLREFQNKIIPIWEEDPGTEGSPKARFSFHEVLTLSSLIEKEARVQDEMVIISSVFCNRLKRKMPLASDPTVVYALGKRYKDKVYYKDLKIDSPYNTYRYSGFTPSPIASIGVMAFKSALTPIDSKYLFFVANKNGTHHFSNTYAEHLAYQKKQKHK